MDNQQNKPQEVPQVKSVMKNEPKEIYLVCFDESETNPDYLPEDNDFDSLEGENVLWSPNDIAGMGTIKYIHHSRIEELEAKVSDLEDALVITKNSRERHVKKHIELEAKNKEYREALEKIVELGKRRLSLFAADTREIAEQALNPKSDG